jgi:hypothetical protein
VSELKVVCCFVADMARDSPVGSPVVSRRNDLNNLNNTYHIDPGLHEQAFQQQILQVSQLYTLPHWSPIYRVASDTSASKQDNSGVSQIHHLLLTLHLNNWIPRARTLRVFNRSKVGLSTEVGRQLNAAFPEGNQPHCF